MERVNNNNIQISILAVTFLLVAVVIIARLFFLQILEYNYYATLALDTHEIYQKINAKRGGIYFKDERSNIEYPAAVNKEYFLIYAVPKEIKETDIVSTTIGLANILKFSEEDKQLLLNKLSKRDSVYTVIAKKQTEDIIDKIREANFNGINFVGQQLRFYPENELAGNILGFTGFNDQGGLQGSYGIEGYWDKILAGRSGFLEGELGAKGGWITLGKKTIIDAEDGANLVLTIDRSLELKACELLRAGWKDFSAKTASLILMNVKTGAILSMCSLPDFDPNNYSKVTDQIVFNNTNIFTPYEPGSVFKPITMAIALDLGLVNPNTNFSDPCKRYINGYEINNALDKCYGQITMTQVLENSVNTGMIWVEEKIGKDLFREGVSRFGFGEKIGISLNTEAKGNISQLEDSRKSDVGYATASFGQGITVTPLQLAVAYAALANGGQMPKPYIVSEVRYANGRKEVATSEIIDNIISPRAAKLLTGMLTSVVEKTYARTVKLSDYYLAAKTGTAQIPGPGGYRNETNHTVAGFFPANDPQFALVVKYEEPDQLWAESTAGPVFSKMADFTLKYYGVKSDR
ncbi:MAG: penicillin-binding protein 2 [Candidatus Magasanikbacteria bacterium]